MRRASGAFGGLMIGLLVGSLVATALIVATTVAEVLVFRGGGRPDWIDPALAIAVLGAFGVLIVYGMAEGWRRASDEPE
jgi:hypothetical protein